VRQAIVYVVGKMVNKMRSNSSPSENVKVSDNVKVSEEAVAYALEKVWHGESVRGEKKTQMRSPSTVCTDFRSRPRKFYIH